MPENNQRVQRILNLIDFTSLNSSDNETSIATWVNQLKNISPEFWPAAICVYPNFVSTVKANVNIPVAAVGACFPSAQSFKEVKFLELEMLNRAAPHEIDVVLNPGLIVEGKLLEAKAELSEIRQLTKGKVLKVILETGVLKDHALIRTAANIAFDVGADFIKTSSGKEGEGATLAAVEIMCEEIKSFYTISNKRIGIKPSGGIRDLETAQKFISKIEEILGEDWIHPDLTRIGASSLYTNLIKELKD